MPANVSIIGMGQHRSAKEDRANPDGMRLEKTNRVMERNVGVATRFIANATSRLHARITGVGPPRSAKAHVILATENFTNLRLATAASALLDINHIANAFHRVEIRLVSQDLLRRPVLAFCLLAIMAAVLHLYVAFAGNRETKARFKKQVRFQRLFFKPATCHQSFRFPPPPSFVSKNFAIAGLSIGHIDINLLTSTALLLLTFWDF